MIHVPEALSNDRLKNWIAAGAIVAAGVTGAFAAPAADPLEPRLPRALEALLGNSPNCEPLDTIRINEVSFMASPGGAQWAELVNYGDAPVPLAGSVLTDGDGNDYVFPAGVGSVPPGGFVVVTFDGLGSGADDYSFGDGSADLHASLVSPFEPIDEAALYDSGAFSPDSIRSFVAWGGVPDFADANDAVAAGIWSDGEFVASVASGPGLDVEVQPGGSTGLLDETSAVGFNDWVTYIPALTTPGAANVIPAPVFRSPPDGQTTDSGDIVFGWSSVADATSYDLTVDDDADFSSPIIQVTVTESQYAVAAALADGTYFFRVRAELVGGAHTADSPAGSVIVESIPAADLGRGANQATLAGFVPLLQHKDTGMLCLEFCDLAGVTPWDARHAACTCNPDGGGNCNPPMRTNCNRHDNMYCARASVAMVNNFHGGDLSQDRISFEYYSPDFPGPDNDLRHGVGMFPSRMARGAGGVLGKDILEWAMGGPGPGGADMERVFAKPTFLRIQQAVAAGTPLLCGEFNNQHAIVITGWRITAAGRRLFQRADPWTGRQAWWNYATYPITEFNVARNTANPRMQEAGVTADADGDGIVDFDETHRFNTNPNLADTDGDGVGDKQDVISYVFRFPFFARGRVVDIDADGLRPERDFDTDNGGLRDGQEDRNANGFWQRPQGETDPFNALDDGPNRLDFVFCIDVTGSMLDDVQAVRAAALNIVNRINQTMPGWRIAIVVYRDFPILPFGNPGDFPFAVLQPFTSNIGQVVAGINQLPGLVGGGGDIPESVYFALSRTLPGNAIGGWRGGAVKRAVMVMGDAPPHDPEPFTGLRLADIVRMAQQLRVGVTQNNDRGGGDGAEAPIDFYNLVIGGNPTAQFFFNELATETGGDLFDAAADVNVVGEILAAIDQIDGTPIVRHTGPYSAAPGQPLQVDLSPSSDGEGCITLYELDTDGDGVFDLSSVQPVLEVALADPACHLLVARVTDDEGFSTIELIDVLVDDVAEPFDCDADGLLDNCEADCDNDGTPDRCEILAGAPDCDGNGVPDDCEADCNANEIADVCEIASDLAADCNLNSVPDECDISSGSSRDCNGNGAPDECEPVSIFQGDMNCDCVVTVSDIAPFVEAIARPASYTAMFPTCDINRADFNGDGQVTVGDIGGMVIRLMGG